MSDALSNFVAGEIRVGLARKNATQEQLAGALGVSQATLSRRLAGKTAFDLRELGAVSEFLGIPLSALLPANDRVPA